MKRDAEGELQFAFKFRQSIPDSSSDLMTNSMGSGSGRSLILPPLLASLVAASFLFSPGTTDVGLWQTWMREISTYGLIGGFGHSGTDYPPLAFVLLAAVIRSAGMLGTSEWLILKWSLLLFLYATSVCFYWFTRNLILTAALELSLTLNSVALGYLDIYFAPFLIAGLFYLQRQKLNRGVLLFAISCFIKWQPLIIAPFVALHVLRIGRDKHAGFKQFLGRTLPFLIAAIAVVAPLIVMFGGAIIHSLYLAMNHDWLSAFALNVGWLHTWLLHLLRPDKYGALVNGMIDSLKTKGYAQWPEKILFYTSYASILVLFARRSPTFERLVVYSILGYLSYFIFNIGVHENHLFLVCCLAWILAFLERGQLVRCINLTIMANANLFLVYGAFGERLNPVIAGIDLTLLFAIANICLFAGFVIHTVRTDGFDLWFVNIQSRTAVER